MIFNISGVGQSTKDATALIDEIVAGKTAFIVNGKVTGTGTRVQSFTTIPSTNQGNLILVNNNIYIWDATSSQYILRYSDEKTLLYIEVSPIEYFYTYGEQIRAVVTAYYDNGVSFDVSSSAIFTPSIATNTTISVSYTDNNITKTSSFNISIIPSESNYSGESRISNEGHGKWTMECFTSGTFTCPLDYNVDIHLVGGGGSGATGTWTDYYNQTFGGAGGGGGYTHSYGPILLYANTQYPIVVGSGGTAPITRGTNGASGGFSSAFSYSVNGGGGGGHGDSTDNKVYGHGGNGGSAGGAGSVYGKSGVSAGGEHGSSTENARINDWTINYGGIGQGRNTYDWFDLDEKTTSILRAGGGGGCGGDGNSTDGEQGALGGHGGGGHGGSVEYNYDATSGVAHKGGGGGGGVVHGSSDSTIHYAGNGGSGIVLIRSHRNNKVDYYYTGNSQFIQDSETAWTLIMLDSGVFSVNKEMSFDLYLLGGGQCGYRGTGTSYGGYSGSFYPGGAGGQGGFITIVSDIILPVGDYNIIVGNGGTGGNGGVGGTTSFGNLYTAPGGGSGATGYLGGAAGGNAGSLDGSNTPDAGGAGEDSTVYDLFGINRGGGGGGGYSARYNSRSDAWSYDWAPASGGNEGGGRSMTNSSGGGRKTTPNYGGGGSGGCNGNGGDGGSGVIIIRTHR